MSSFIGKLGILVTANTSGFSAGLKGASKKVGQFVDDIGGLKSVVAGLGAAAGIGGLLALTKSSIDNIGALNDQATALGVSTLALSGLQYAAGFASVSSEQLAGGMKKMLDTLGNAQAGSQSAIAGFTGIGLTLDQLQGKTPDEQFKLIADGIAAIHDPAARTTAAMNIFGKSGSDLIPVLALGSKGLSEMQANALKMGVAISDVDAAKVDAAGDSMDNVGQLVTGLGNTIAIGLAPYITGVCDGLVAMATAGEGMSKTVGTGLEYVVAGAVGLTNIIDLGIGAWQGLRGIAGAVVTGLVMAVDDLGSALVSVINLIPGMSVEWSSAIHDMATALDVTTTEAFAKSGEAFTAAWRGDRSSAIQDAMVKARITADNAAADAVKHPKGGGFVPPNVANMDGIEKVMDGIAKKNMEWGLSETERARAQLIGLHATDQQLAAFDKLATTMNALDGLQGINAGGVLDTYAAKMERLNDLFRQGVIDKAKLDVAIKGVGKERNSGLDALAQQIIADTQTPMEKYQKQITDLQALLDTGRITQEQFARADASAQKTRDSALPSDKGKPPELAAVSRNFNFAVPGLQKGADKQIDLARRQVDLNMKMVKGIDQLVRNTTGGGGFESGDF